MATAQTHARPAVNLDTFRVRAAVMHDVPRGGDEDEQLVLTDAPITLDDQLRTYFRRKIIKSLSSRGLDVVVDPNQDACVRRNVTRVLVSPDTLVDASKQIAAHLDTCQTGRNPPGLLAVVLAEIDGVPCLSILKLEREQGLRFHIRTDQDGRHVVDLELLRELTLTDKTKVFKTSLLQAGRSDDASSVHGRVSDDQRGMAEGNSVASFFLSTFLGCTLRRSPEKATLEFVRASERYFNESVTNPERHGRYQVALLARMQDQTLDIRPRDFAWEHLDEADRSPFLEALRQAGIDTDSAFAKDTSLVKVNRFRMVFESGMVLVGGREDLSDRVDIREETADRPGVEVNDAIEKLSGH